MDITLSRSRTTGRSKVADFDLEKPQNKKKTWQVIFLMVLFALAVQLVLPKLMDIRHGFDVIREMIWWLIALAFLAEATAYLGTGFCLQALLNLHQNRLNIFDGAMIWLASTSIGLVAGGWVGAAAATIRFVSKRGASKSSATMAGILPSMLLNGAIILVALSGTVFLAVTDRITTSQSIQYSVFILLLVIFTYGYLLALVFPNATYKVVNWALWNWSRWRKKPYDPAKTKQNVDAFIQAWKTLRNGNWLLPMLGAVAYVLFDMLCLYLVFLAAGYPLNLGVLLAGYGLPFLVVKMAFILPGGVGVFEATMTAIFVSLDVPKDICIVAVIGYRLISFWVPIIAGFIFSPILTRSKSVQISETTP